MTLLITLVILVFIFIGVLTVEDRRQRQEEAHEDEFWRGYNEGLNDWVRLGRDEARKASLLRASQLPPSSRSRGYVRAINDCRASLKQPTVES